MNLEFNKEKLITTIIATVAVLIVFGFAKFVTAPSSDFSFIKKNQEVPEPDKEVIEEKKELSIVFLGDIMLSRTVNSRMERYNDYNWPFLKVYNFLNQADLVVANLESPFLKDSNYQVLSGSFSFKANPLAVSGLKLANISLLSLANNHTINQGKKGIEDTIDILKENDIKYVGAGLNEEDARRAAIITINDARFAFLSYAYPEDYSLATENRAGIAGMNLDKMEKDVNDLKNSNEKPDLIIVLMHAGNEYVLEPNWQQKLFARKAIEVGADIVVGHHPHWPQVFEFYQEKPIIYSLGNFVFDQMWSEETRQGLLLKLVWQEGIKSLELIPSKIYDYGQVKILDKEIETEKIERENILKKIKANISGIIYEREE